MSFTFNFPSYTVGQDAYNYIEEVCLKYGKKAVIIGGKTALSKAKPYLENSLKDSKIEVVDYIIVRIDCMCLPQFGFQIIYNLMNFC